MNNIITHVPMVVATSKEIHKKKQGSSCGMMPKIVLPSGGSNPRNLQGRSGRCSSGLRQLPFRSGKGCRGPVRLVTGAGLGGGCLQYHGDPVVGHSHVELNRNLNQPILSLPPTYRLCPANTLALEPPSLLGMLRQGSLQPDQHVDLIDNSAKGSFMVSG